ncbi:CLI_3235 family bacteriocin precursor [Ruminiclostridium herbifermentans]|uniref:CLI_3235 family bacteriocin n=1 Tax=Ruminiclostridium herbifermentans TaxID=2488810 RepID=A0A4U7JEZ0_9FIRM|nr:CLI_3235 family bacteriocin precursor [Ruminiclostridium herbifermentans]QNU67325.1 CLI_3235 family bacteriocin precursor [Ruminiclostridium herbifermentans]
MKKLGKKFHEVKETLESYSCTTTCTCYCGCNCNPTTCGGNTSAIATTGSSSIGYNSSSVSSSTRNTNWVYA